MLIVEVITARRMWATAIAVLLYDHVAAGVAVQSILVPAIGKPQYNYIIAIKGLSVWGRY